MTTYQKVFAAYVKAVRDRRNALTEGDWYMADQRAKIFKKWLDKHNHIW